MTDTCKLQRRSCVFGLLFWLASIIFWAGFIVLDTSKSDPLWVLGLGLPGIMMAFWITSLSYWCFYARPDARSGRARSERIVTAVSWTLGTLFLLLLAGLMLLG